MHKDPHATHVADHLDLAATQLGLLTPCQLRAIGWSNAKVRYRIRTGDLARVSDRVLLVRGSPWNAPTRVMAAVLDVGHDAGLARSSALAWWGLRGFALERAHVLRPHGPGGPVDLLGIVHQSRVLPPHHIVLHRSVPVTTPARALLDIAESVHPGRLERALENAWAERLVTYRSMVDVLETGPRTKVGHPRLAALVAARGPDYRPCESALEMRVKTLMAEAGLTFRRQIDSGGDDWVGRTDFREAVLPLILEVQSERYHETILDAAADERRIEALEAAGFTVLEIREFDVWHDPKAMVRRVRSACDALRHERSA